ncbi:hypothetical protein [Paracidobacterium acidisoli]|uniref:Uncharacterized protein n=1 Tax=Paracidobacterium acidisoli TaxID=2303751 RepID=A0A372IM99_9BACT|nr:hypothetical protein [Paracidobacterium acidisoli]MBT9331618.1 hypothetical protein [Paracidobacterium acidisoli]
MKKHFALLLAVVVVGCSGMVSFAQHAMLLSNVRRIYIEKMADNLDQYLASSISGKFHGTVTVVLDRRDADAILRGVNIGAQTTEKATVELVDPGEHQVLWSGTAGDRKMLTLDIGHGGQQKMADNLMGQLRKAMRR